MLDERDLNGLDSLIEDAVNIDRKGFFCVLGPVELFSPSIQELQNRFENKKRIFGGKKIDMQAIDEYVIDDLFDALPPVVYFFGFAKSPIWDKIKIKRDIAQKVIVIFFLNPSQYRQLLNQYSSIASLLMKTYPIGAQHTLDDMGDEFRDRLHEVLDRISKC